MFLGYIVRVMKLVDSEVLETWIEKFNVNTQNSQVFYMWARYRYGWETTLATFKVTFGQVASLYTTP